MSAFLALQAAVIEAMRNDPGVTALIGARSYDRPPDNAVHPYVTLGPADAFEDDAEGITALEVTQQIDVWSLYQGGQSEARRVADAVRKALHNHETALADGTLVDMRVTAVRVMADPDGVTSHGVVTIQALVDE